MKRLAWLSLVMVLGCGRKTPLPAGDASPPPAPSASAVAPFTIPALAVPPAPVMSREEAMRARDDFELAPDAYALGTSQVFHRSLFLPLDSRLAYDEGDWIGRLRAAFGARANDVYVFRHKSTGFVVTAYFGKGGAAFGGAYRMEGALSPQGRADAGLFTPEDDARVARIAADPILAAKSPRDRALAHHQGKLPAELFGGRALRDADRQWDLHFARVAAPPGSAPVIERLAAILEAVTPLEWSGLRYWADGGEVIRVGLRNGASFSETLPAAEGLAALLAAAESKPGHAPIGGGGPIGIDYDVVRYWLGHPERVAALEAERKRVHNAWFRLAAQVKQLHGPDAGTDDRLATAAKADALKLGIEPAKADAALR